MDFHDFEKFNGKDIEEIISKEIAGGLNRRIVEISGVEVVEEYDEFSETIDYRLYDKERLVGGKIIGHAEMRTLNNKVCFVFEASDEEWT